MKLLRYCPLIVADILEGCRKLLGDGYSSEQYNVLIDIALNDFFFIETESHSKFYTTSLSLSETELTIVREYLSRELHTRIQRSFGIIYPNRRYDWVYERVLQEIVIREFSDSDNITIQPDLTNEEPTNDICDDWIPERLRPR